MPIIIGREIISSTQSSLLNSAKEKTIPVQDLYENLNAVIKDGEIGSGEEHLHPGWLEVFESNQERLRRNVPPDRFERIQQFFSSLAPIDPAAYDIDPTKRRVSFLLGAGASKPEPSGIPTIKELLPDLLSRARRLDRDEVTKLADFCDGTGIDNIEDLLTAAQLSEFCSRNPDILRLVDFLLFRQEPRESYLRNIRRRIPADVSDFQRRLPVDFSSVAFLQDTLQVLFGLLSSRMLPAEPNSAHEAISKFLVKHPDSSIVTTNYDCCIDRALHNQGIPFTYLLDFNNIQASDADETVCTQLIKLHGSLNWFYCETCQQTQLIDIETTVINYREDRVPYPVIAVCKACGGQRRGLVVPPLAMKFDIAPPLNPLLDRAGEAFINSNLIIVVGFSFADADLYISRMLSKVMQQSNATQLLVFDPAYEVAIKVRRKFSTRIPNFDESRIIAIRGDCSDLLPKFLARKLVAASTTPKTGDKRVH